MPWDAPKGVEHRPKPRWCHGWFGYGSNMVKYQWSKGKHGKTMGKPTIWAILGVLSGKPSNPIFPFSGYNTLWPLLSYRSYRNFTEEYSGKWTIPTSNGNVAWTLAVNPTSMVLVRWVSHLLEVIYGTCDTKIPHVSLAIFFGICGLKLRSISNQMSEYYGEDVLFEAAEEVETAPTVVALQNFQDNCCRFVKIIIMPMWKPLAVYPVRLFWHGLV